MLILHQGDDLTTVFFNTQQKKKISYESNTYIKLDFKLFCAGIMIKSEVACQIQDESSELSGISRTQVSKIIT